MTTCNLCNAEIIWHENLRCFVTEATGQRHGIGYCMIKVPRFKVDNGVSIQRKDEYLARDITDAAVKLHINPFRVRPIRDGDFLIIKR